MRPFPALLLAALLLPGPAAALPVPDLDDLLLLASYTVTDNAPDVFVPLPEPIACGYVEVATRSSPFAPAPSRWKNVTAHVDDEQCLAPFANACQALTGQDCCSVLPDVDPCRPSEIIERVGGPAGKVGAAGVCVAYDTDAHEVTAQNRNCWAHEGGTGD